MRGAASVPLGPSITMRGAASVPLGPFITMRGTASAPLGPSITMRGTASVPLRWLVSGLSFVGLGEREKGWLCVSLLDVVWFLVVGLG